MAIYSFIASQLKHLLQAPVVSSRSSHEYSLANNRAKVVLPHPESPYKRMTCGLFFNLKALNAVSLSFALPI